MYKPFEEIIFRFPIYPVETIKKALADEDYFNEIITSNFFKKAIFFASPVLYEELLKYFDNKQKEKDRIRTKNSLVRYLTRMSSRCTPFGMFASCSIGYTGEKNDLLLSDEFKIHTRFDMLYLCSLAQHLERIKDIRQVVKYYVNTTLYPRGNKLRYIEYQFNTQKRIFQLVEISKNPYLTIIINKVKNGAYIHELIDLLTKDDIPYEDASDFIDKIIDNQILISEIDPIVTGDDFFEHIIDVVERIDHNSELYQQLTNLKKLLHQVNLHASDDDTHIIEVCNEIEEEIKKINIPYQKKFLLQTDTIRKLERNTLGSEIIQSVQDAMVFLNKITSRFDNGTLNDFKQAFSKKYEEREIPLLEALDPEFGIGYPVNQANDINPLIDGLALPMRQSGSPQFSMTPLQVILQRKLVAFNRKEEIVIEEKDVESLTANWDDLPATLFTMVQIIDNDKSQTNYDLLLSSFGGCSAANLLGRFAYCDTQLFDTVKKITEKEKEIYKDHIVAEISHIPDSRVGNILARPNFRDYEILYLANSTRPREQVIYPSDILISVKYNQILLRSKTLNKYIIPRLSTAHNYRNNPTPIYRFLCELQAQNIRPVLTFQWGALDQQLEYLPRVRYKNIILSVAKWKVNKKSIEHLIQEKNISKLEQEISKWREELHLPRYVTLSDSDNTLLVDLENMTSIEAFFSVLTNRQSILLEEFLEVNPTFIKDTRGVGYANECIVSFHKPLN